ncbi:MAG: flagellar export protein FliJ [Deltaproteobacteria bacterium]|nr:MAG: flagellar export protein FliJ [Deltaproteobacteria bacterium]
MRAFRFKLDTLLRVRQLREDQARLELARLLNILAETRQTLTDSMTLKAKLLAKWHQALEKSLSGADYQLFQNYWGFLQQSIAALKEDIKRQEGQIQSQREKLVKLSQERRLLEKLKNKKRIIFKRQQTAQMQKEADEIALLRRTL